MAELLDLTTIAQRLVDQGVLVAQQILDALVGERAALPSQIVVPTRLVVRGSTGPPHGM
jgi:DNA-binding LacI/PurR family transcriptional regulator